MSLATTFQKWRFGKQYGYETLFKNQNRAPLGKVGIILAEMGVPEDYEFKFYNDYMRHVFEYSLPPFLVPVVLRDRGIALLDPERVLEKQAFQPKQLIDYRGSFTNKAGKPYTECPLTWVAPRSMDDPFEHGYFLYKEDGPGGAPEVCQKVGAKIKGWYYDRLFPEKKVAWRAQHQRICQETNAILKEKYPELEFACAAYIDTQSLRQAVDSLLALGCQTIVYQCISNPIYSDFEEYAHTMPALHEIVGSRARLIFADQIGNQPALHGAFAAILRDQLAQIPSTADVLVILSRHGHPFKKDTQDARAPQYRRPVEAAVRDALKDWKGRTEVIWSDDEYADSQWDKTGKKMETKRAYERAIEEGFDYAIEIPTEFLGENTDLMVFHAMKKFNVFPDYDIQQPIPYPDWEKPLVRTFHKGKTTGIYAGCAVGPYRKYVVQATVDSIASLLQ